MHSRTSFLLVAAVAATVAAATGVRAQAARSLWDGVYSAPQAERGKALFVEKCAACHGADLKGSDAVPALSGSAFLGNWDGLAVGDLFDRISNTMPQTDPGSLKDPQVVDLIAYILSVDGFPAGAGEIGTDKAVLKATQIDAKKPAGK